MLATNFLNMAKLCHLPPVALLHYQCLPSPPNFSLRFETDAFFCSFFPSPTVGAACCEEKIDIFGLQNDPVSLVCFGIGDCSDYLGECFLDVGRNTSSTVRNASSMKGKRRRIYLSVGRS